MTKPSYKYTGYDCIREKYVVSVYYGWASSRNKDYYFKDFVEAMKYLDSMTK